MAKSQQVWLPGIPSGQQAPQSGTSFSAPMIAGLAALMWSVPSWDGSVYPGIRYSPEGTKAVLMAAGDLEGRDLVRYDASQDGKFGAGIPKAERIVEIAENQQSGTWHLWQDSFTNGVYVLDSSITIPAGHKIRAVMVQGSCHTGGEEFLASNIDLELYCNESVFADSRSEVNEYEILEYEAPTTTTCTLRVNRESWQDCIQWPSGGPGDSLQVGYAFYISAPPGD